MNLNGTFINEFSLLPFDGSFDNTDIHRMALEYNYPPEAFILEKGNGFSDRFSNSPYQRKACF